MAVTPDLYEIYCVELLHPSTHRHITGVGVSHFVDGRREYQRLTVDQVLTRMAGGGQVFSTGDFGEGDMAYVDRYTCSHCGRDTIRTRGDQTTKNNLDELRECS